MFRRRLAARRGRKNGRTVMTSYDVIVVGARIADAAAAMLLS